MRRFFSLRRTNELSQVVTAIPKTALYPYATEDERVGPFADLVPDRGVFSRD